MRSAADGSRGGKASYSDSDSGCAGWSSQKVVVSSSAASAPKTFSSDAAASDVRPWIGSLEGSFDASTKTGES
jgi:hypothetical protein